MSEYKNCVGVETCVCCGAVIPEGRQVCPDCEKALDKDNNTKLMEVLYGRSFCRIYKGRKISNMV